MRLIAAAMILFMSPPVRSETISAPVQDAIQAATEQAQHGDPRGAMQVMLDLLETLSDSNGETHPAGNDRVASVKVV